MSRDYLKKYVGDTGDLILTSFRDMSLSTDKQTAVYAHNVGMSDQFDGYDSTGNVLNYGENKAPLENCYCREPKYAEGDMFDLSTKTSLPNRVLHARLA